MGIVMVWGCVTSTTMTEHTSSGTDWPVAAPESTTSTWVRSRQLSNRFMASLFGIVIPPSISECCSDEDHSIDPGCLGRAELTRLMVT
ncbi:hypothetical protein AVEN_127903-1 [Araneus ventricosus]|uniref:Uncharacterized protein n=1 Tax=Araneus ventricosus TaxID=182803 RepID=A0A4Y1ZYR8_ARAVE|nr:hypothetical protein AVEN_127903-1 [Araneus ventricosus]